MTERTWAEREALKLAKLIGEEVARRREETGEIVDPDDEDLVAFLEGSTSAVEMVNYLAERVKRLEAEAVGLRAQADHYALPLYDAAKKRDDRADRDKKRLLTILDMVGQKKLGRVSKRVSGQPPVTWLVDEKDLPKVLPESYWTVPEAPKPKPDKAAIRAALKNKDLAQGLQGIATLGNGTPTLIIE